LEKSIEKNLQNAAAYYNLGLLYQQQNQATKAENTFLRGIKNIPGNERLLYALTHFYLQERNREQAKRYALELNRLFPGRQDYIGLLELIQN
jgi:tetratricopeptide (TPR) repeat protein